MSRLERIEAQLDPISNYGFSIGLVLVIFGAVVYTLLPDEIVSEGLHIVWNYLPLWLTIVFGIVFYERWMEYVQTEAFLNLDRVLLEIKLPEEITQSPLAMETALNSFYYTGEPDTVHDKYIKGQTRSQFSLEIVSFEGEVRFFIQTRQKNRNIIEAQLYSHYPTIEIHEVPDYMEKLPYDTKRFKLWGIYQKLQKPDPYPIKTYIDYGLDSETKEEFKVDPMNGVLEFFGSLGKGEYAFLQIIIRSHQAEKSKPGTWFEKESWTGEAEREVEKIIGGLEKSKESVVSFRSFTEGEKKTIESLQRNTGKKPFDVGARIFYMAEIDHYRSERHAGLPTMMRSFESEGSNGFKPVSLAFSYPWEDPFGIREKARKEELYEGYRLRSFLTPPIEKPYFVLSAEELATVFHFPGKVSQTPTVGRITSRREWAPPNLPQ